MTYNNNMNNKINKTKTILFASLIAAMILPFSGMNVADAVLNENANEHANAKEKIKSLKDKAQKEKANTDKEKVEKQKRIERLDLAEKLINLQSQNKGQSVEAKEIRKNLIDKMQEYTFNEIVDAPFDGQFPNSEKSLSIGSELLVMDNVDSAITQAGSGVTRNFDTSNIYRTDCSQTKYGDSHGTIIAWNTNSYVQGFLVGSSDYPSSTTVNCSNKSFDAGNIWYYDVYAPWETCIQIFDSSHYSRAGYCSGLQTNDLLLVEAQAWYQGNIWSLFFSNQWVAL